MAETTGVAPPLGDIIVHEHDVVDEHDVRGLSAGPWPGIPPRFWYTSDQLLTVLQTRVPLRVTVEDAKYRSGPHDRAQIRLRTTRFEALRWRTGRRSRAQLAAMDWSGDPTPVLDLLYMFGPADADVIE